MLKSQSLTFILAALKSFTWVHTTTGARKIAPSHRSPYFAMHPSQSIQSVGHLLPFNKKKVDNLLDKLRKKTSGQRSLPDACRRFLVSYPTNRKVQGPLVYIVYAKLSFVFYQTWMYGNLHYFYRRYITLYSDDFSYQLHYSKS